VPRISSFVSSFVGAGPEGGVTFGSLDSGPLVGVVAASAHGVGLPDGHFVLVGLDFSPALINALSALFSLPTVIVLEPPEPQPAIRTVAPSAAAARPVRRMMEGEVLK
jgi:hypothetical protein